MCKVTRNLFTCTKNDTTHLVLDHSYPSSQCNQRNLKTAEKYLFRYCGNAVFFDKVFPYDCELCLDGQVEERREARKAVADQIMAAHPDPPEN
jgi:hypothetical protein